MSDLLSKLDVNADGQIDVNDLKTAMESMTLPALPSEAQARLCILQNFISGLLSY